MTIDTDKAKRALDALSQECQAQNDRLQLAALAIQFLDDPLHVLCQISSVKERFGF